MVNWLGRSIDDQKSFAVRVCGVATLMWRKRFGFVPK